MEEITMRDYLKVLFRQKWVVITVFVTVMATVAVGLMLKTPVYESSVKLLVSAQKQVEASYYTALTGSQNNQAALTQSEIVKSNPVIERAVKALGLYQKPLDYEKRFCSPLKAALVSLRVKSMNAKLKRLTPRQKEAFLFRMAVEDLKKNIKVEPLRDTNMFTITVRDFSPVGAAVIANVVSRSYVIFDLEQQLAELKLKYGEKHPAVIQLKDNIEKMIKSLNGKPLPNVEAIGPASVKIIEQATIPFEPAGIPKILTLILAFFMAVFLGIMLAFTFEYLDQTFKSPQDIEKFLNLPFLGYIPKKAGPESYHSIASQIYLLMKDKNLKSILITAALPGEGVSVITANIAKTMSSHLGQKTLIIDTNLRKPSVHNILKTPASAGLSGILEGKISLDKAVIAAGDNLAVLPAGKTKFNPVTLLESRRMQELLKAAENKYEIILLDSVNLRDYKDAVMLAVYTGGVILVINEGKTRRQAAKRAIASLEQRKAVLLGAVLNNRTFVIPKAIYERV